MLRYWLAACGIDPEKDVDIVVVPPPFTGEALASGEIHGACVGEPWNSLAVDAGAAEIRSEEHTSELQSLMRISYAVFCLKKNKSRLQTRQRRTTTHTTINK